MERAGLGTAWGIVLAVVFAAAVPLSNPTPAPLDRALSLVRAQDASPAFESAGRRLQAHFAAMDEDAFIGEIFSLKGKWKALTLDRRAWRDHVQDVFEKHLFNPAALEVVLRDIAEDFRRVEEGQENRLRAALTPALRGSRPEISFPVFESAPGEFASAVTGDLVMNVVAIGGGEAITMPVLAAGGGFGWGLIVGLVAGVALDALVGEAHEGMARGEVRLCLNGLRNRILDDVVAALGSAVAARRRAQERCVRKIFERGAYDDMAYSR